MRIDPEHELHTLRETQVSSQTIFDGFILHVRKDTVTLPNGTQENIATVQLGILLDRIATLSPALIPNLLNICESSRHLCLKLS